jgi:hypothetical protein
MAGAWEGAMRVRRDVVVQHQPDGSLAVISHLPGVTDEILTLDLVGTSASASLTVQVLDSRPVVMNGALRHALRVAVLDGDRISA